MRKSCWIAAATVIAFFFVVQAWLCPPARADKVHLKNNETIEGLISKETPDEVVIDFGFGQTTLDRKNIINIEKCPFTPPPPPAPVARKSQPQPAAPALPKPVPPKKPPTRQFSPPPNTGKGSGSRTGSNQGTQGSTSSGQTNR